MTKVINLLLITNRWIMTVSIMSVLVYSNQVLALPNGPDIPIIERPVHLTDNGQFQRPYIPAVRSTIDGRLALQVQAGPGGRQKFFLMVPERLDTHFNHSTDQNPLLTDSEGTRLPPRNTLVSGGTVGPLLGICEQPNADGAHTNPRACGVNEADDCYDINIIAPSFYEGGPNGKRMQIWSTPTTIRVSNPKTESALIDEVLYGTPVGGSTRFDADTIFEIMNTADGNLMIGRVDNAQFTWHNLNTNLDVSGQYNMVYFPAPVNPTKACDPEQWNTMKPLGHAPYDPTIKTVYGFAAQPFRDSMGHVIPDETDLGGTYPWIDSLGDNIGFLSYGFSIQAEQAQSGMTLSCVPERGCNNLRDNGPPLQGATIMGLWTNGKSVMMDNLITNVDYDTVGINDDLHRMIDMYSPNSQIDGTGSGLVRVGNGEGQSNNTTGTGPIAQGTPDDTAFFESVENKLFHRKLMLTGTPRDVVWHISKGWGTDEFAFDDFMMPDAFIVTDMVPAVRNNGNSIFAQNGLWHNGNPSPNQQPARLQNGSSSHKWNVPSYGEPVNARIERVALGGIRGRGLWLDGDATAPGHLLFDIPSQPINTRTADWHISLFLDPRFSDDGSERVLLSFPDGSEIRLIGRDRVRYTIADTNIRTFSLPDSARDNGWRHLGVQMTNSNTEATFYYNGFNYDHYDHGTPMFEFSPGQLYIGDDPIDDVMPIRGWIDEFKVFARESTIEEWCNHANGTIIGLNDNSPQQWQTLAMQFPIESHQLVSNKLAQRSGQRIYSQYACYADYSDDNVAHLQNIPDDTIGLRDPLLFPEGPLTHDAPRPDTQNNQFCLSCHQADAPKGLGLEALMAGMLNAVDDPRRQPHQPHPKMFGNIPANLFGPGLPSVSINADDINGIDVDRFLLPAAVIFRDGFD